MLHGPRPIPSHNLLIGPTFCPRLVSNTVTASSTTINNTLARPPASLTTALPPSPPPIGPAPAHLSPACRLLPLCYPCLLVVDLSTPPSSSYCIASHRVPSHNIVPTPRLAFPIPSAARDTSAIYPPQRSFGTPYLERIHTDLRHSPC
ncbi:uncharacterized protein PSFLO_03249 [Pseudozyma flocculosa]|uniref:Uncharacterized protein n=1 Tax=Pseudozyma flocculosa TaxID=84751 RepID=A0A5C3EZS0_9BASI|nr:uncharacterized protein PSFLO_03249 [Pseudozyma flocculosa]